MTYRKKLIEVALPLEEINKAAAREKSIRHGHPSTLHLWWARRPLAACRAVIFASIIDDPGEEGVPEELLERIDELPIDRKYKGLEAEALLDPEGKPLSPELEAKESLARIRRYKLFTFIETLVQWESTTDKAVLKTARDLIHAATGGNPPPLHDPFCGGGSIPLEAQRLGLEAYGSDLNPVAVLITKAMIEIPPKFAGLPPVNPESRKMMHATSWEGAQGLAEDVRFYGQWMRDEAEKRIGQLYPKVKVTREMVDERPDLRPYLNRELTVIAWIWARTVKSPNPAFRDVDVPLASTFMLSTKPGKEAYVEPIISKGTYNFEVRLGRPKDPDRAKAGTKLARGANFKCLLSESPIRGDYIKAEGLAGRMDATLMAVVANGDGKRVYLSPTESVRQAVSETSPEWKPTTELAPDPRALWTPAYGLKTFGDLFTNRQLVALTTFSDLVAEAREKAKADALEAGLADDGLPLDSGGTGAQAYADAVATYLAFAVDKCTDYWSSLCSWHVSGEKMRNTFGRQAIPMVWDFAEGNPFCDSTGNFMAMVDWTWKAVTTTPAQGKGFVVQADVQTQSVSMGKAISTDPPYYDNIGYADLSDFFYVWIRRCLQDVYPRLFATMAVPKTEELVATPYRHGSKDKAEEFFLNGMTQAMTQLSDGARTDFPFTLFYAFKQSETENLEGTTNTGWSTFLEALVKAGLAVLGTWPMRTELANKLIAIDSNVLASSIVLVCRKRKEASGAITRREFLAELQSALPEALDKMTQGNIAPVDLAQASIGPGMAVFSRYKEVLEPTGEPMSVRTALQLINQALDEALAAQEGWYDSETRFAVTWFRQRLFGEGPYGEAEVLALAKDAPVAGLESAGILKSGGGKVRLLRRDELPQEYDPATDRRPTVWEATQYLCRALDQQGESGAARLMRRFRETQPGLDIDRARELAYRLYAVCEQRKWSAEARVYNALVVCWTDIETKSHDSASGWIEGQGGTGVLL